MSPLSSAPSVAPILLALAQGLSAALLLIVQTALLVYASHRTMVLFRAWRHRRRPRAPAPPPTAWPAVTVQLPVFNEPRVIERLIDAVAALDYPREALEIQVLDDSTDDTTELGAAAITRARAHGVDIVLRHRARRDRFKAGALAAGLGAARGELIAVFDADFVPSPDFLRRLVPHFSDPTVGMVQARWGHLNRDRSPLTMAQAVMLDAHFLLEHETRMRAGLFINFNGSAGVWRRRCIEEAGGWTSDTLTEDLDLSYRAQLAGWRFVFDGGVVVPAELPADVRAFRSQQRRWARGSIQTARKILPRLGGRALPNAVRLEAWLHLTGNAAYPLLLLLGLLLLPVMLAGPPAPSGPALALHLGAVVAGVIPLVAFLAAGQRAAGLRGFAIVRDVAAAVIVGAGLSFNNSCAVLGGLGDRLGAWERTPKTGDENGLGSRPRAARFGTPTMLPEVALAAYFAVVAALSIRLGEFQALSLALLLATGLGALAVAARAPARGA